MDDARTTQHNPPVRRAGSPASRRDIRRQLLATLLIGGAVSLTSTGCAGRSMSLASMNPFQGTPDAALETESPNRLASATSKVKSGTDKVASTTSKAASGAMSTSKNFVAKTSSTIGSWFGREGEKADPEDPLALDSDSEQLQPDVFVANGQLWESTGNLTKAMESYAQALESDPNNGAAFTSIARLHFREGRYPESAEYFQKAIAQNPEDAALYNDLGLTLSKLGQHDLAAQTLKKALELAPGTSRYANNLASVQFESGKTDEALEVLQANNKAAVAHFNMAFLYYKKGQTEQAKTQLTESLAYENEAAADPATKRAIDRSREMLAQLGVSGQSPATPTNPATGLPQEIGPAAGPAAVIAAAPAHRANQAPQVLGQMTPQTKTSTPMTPVSYQDPRSYMSPQLPSDVADTPSTGPAATPAATSTPAQPEAAAPSGSPGGEAPEETGAGAAAPPSSTPSPKALPPSTPPSATGFGLPGGFQFPGI